MGHNLSKRSINHLIGFINTLLVAGQITPVDARGHDHAATNPGCARPARLVPTGIGRQGHRLVERSGSAGTGRGRSAYEHAVRRRKGIGKVGYRIHTGKRQGRRREAVAARFTRSGSRAHTLQAEREIDIWTEKLKIASRNNALQKPARNNRSRLLR